MSRLRLSVVTTPDPPAAGKIELWVSNDSVPRPRFQDSDGNVKDFALGPVVSQSTPANPTGTTDLTGKMMGLALAVTPELTGNVKLTITGSMSNDTINDGAAAQIRYGTGTAPANAAALTGTAAGAVKTFTSLVAADRHGFMCVVYLTGLTLGTAYWVDLSLKAITGGTANLFDLDMVAEES
jgi:hypothetical protein